MKNGQKEKLHDHRCKRTVLLSILILFAGLSLTFHYDDSDDDKDQDVGAK